MSDNFASEQLSHALDEIERLRAEKDLLVAVLWELGDYHDDGGQASKYTQGMTAAVLGEDWWDRGRPTTEIPTLMPREKFTPIRLPGLLLGFYYSGDD